MTDASADQRPPQPQQPGPTSHAGVGLERVSVCVRRLDSSLPLPSYARTLVPTGIAIALPEGYAGFTHPRSGMAARHGITIVNAPGTVDAGYRGEILVNLVNLDASEPFEVRRGDRIAQLIVQRVAETVFVEVDSLPDSSRGETGHGASGGFGPRA